MSTRAVVLLWERDEAARTVLKAALEEARARVAALPSAPPGAAFLSAQLLAVSLLTDEEGLALLARWRETAGGAAVPALAIHAAGDDALAMRALAAGADDVLAWPAPVPVLHARLRNLALSSALREEGARVVAAFARLVAAHEGREAVRAGHAARTAAVAEALAREAGLAPAERERLHDAALVHDIGFLALPDRILAKADALTSDEAAQIRTHPSVGAALLGDLPALAPLRPFVLRHHERVDGSGYPDGLAGTEIPLSVQVLGLADAWDGLTSMRPHRGMRSDAQAMETLRGEARAGTWDAELVRLLERVAAEAQPRR